MVSDDGWTRRVNISNGREIFVVRDDAASDGHTMHVLLDGASRTTKISRPFEMFTRLVQPSSDTI